MAVSRVGRIFTRQMSLKKPLSDIEGFTGILPKPASYDGFMARKKAAYVGCDQLTYLNVDKRKKLTMNLVRLLWVVPFIGWLYITDKRGTKKN